MVATVEKEGAMASAFIDIDVDKLVADIFDLDETKNEDEEEELEELYSKDWVTTPVKLNRGLQRRGSPPLMKSPAEQQAKIQDVPQFPVSEASKDEKD
eukprot:4904201-Karenia_brevis.AAC.1